MGVRCGGCKEELPAPFEESLASVDTADSDLVSESPCPCVDDGGEIPPELLKPCVRATAA